MKFSNIGKNSVPQTPAAAKPAEPVCAPETAKKQSAPAPDAQPAPQQQHANQPSAPQPHPQTAPAHETPQEQQQEARQEFTPAVPPADQPPHGAPVKLEIPSCSETPGSWNCQEDMAAEIFKKLCESVKTIPGSQDGNVYAAFPAVFALAEAVDAQFENGSENLLALLPSIYASDSVRNVLCGILACHTARSLNADKNLRLLACLTGLMLPAAEAPSLSKPVAPATLQEIAERLYNISSLSLELEHKLPLSLHAAAEFIFLPDKRGDTPGEAPMAAGQFAALSLLYGRAMSAQHKKSAPFPYSAMRAMLPSGKNSYAEKIVKAMVEGLSMFPPGTIVALSTGEIARVVGVNKGMLTRPKLELLASASGTAMPSGKILNLKDEPLVLITSTVDIV